ncbi:Ubiquitin domain [Macleaya cordata]|uniref:Ubiquitin domain n=1 Tax=Macleaya cordata TaxID=56857 RepID=A0A200RCS3_MACCD|nr:Ubiquitin domain [Macleaya cordata]
MIKLRSKRFFRSNSKLNGGGGGVGVNVGGGGGGEIKWELRPGGMLVQKREDGGSSTSTTTSGGDGMMITVRVSTESRWHDISIESTSTFGELKLIVSLVTSLEPREQRVLFKGKEREDGDYLHMVGVRDKDKVLVLEDPAIKERKKHAATLLMGANQPIGRTISV